jgi:hypothetical protein
MSHFRGSIFKCQTGIKDFSDFLMYNGLDKTKSLIEKFIKLNNDIQEDVF